MSSDFDVSDCGSIINLLRELNRWKHNLHHYDDPKHNEVFVK